MENNALIWLLFQGEKWDAGCDSSSAALLCWPNFTWRQELQHERSEQSRAWSLPNPLCTPGVLHSGNEKPGRWGNPGICRSGIREGSQTAIKVTIKPNPNQRGPWTTNRFFSSVFLCGVSNTPTPLRRFGWLGPYQLFGSHLARTTHTSPIRAGIWCLLPGRTDKTRQVQIKSEKKGGKIPFTFFHSWYPIPSDTTCACSEDNQNEKEWITMEKSE